MTGALLTTPRLMLRRVEPDDAGPLAALLAGDSAGIAMTARIPDPATEEGTREWIDGVLRDGGHAFTIIHRDGGQPLGVAGWMGCDSPADSMPEIGYWIARAHRRRGFGREAVAGVLAHLAQNGARGAVAEVFLDNAASLALLLRLGFRASGLVERDLPLRGGLRRLQRLVIDGPPFAVT